MIETLAAEVARPASEEEVVALVREARRRRRPLVPVGSRTSFWGSTRLPGAMLVDLRGLDRELGHDPAESVVRVQAGMTIAALQRRLSSRGLELAAYPDGVGDATIGSLVANDTSAGVGMQGGAASRQVVSLTAVAGTGERLRLGASRAVEGFPDFARSGMPDIIGLMLASEGALAIVTELALRVEPRPLARAFRAEKVPFAAAIAAAQALRFGGLARSWVCECDDSGREIWRVVVVSHHGMAELRARGARLASVLSQAKPLKNVPGWERGLQADDGWRGLGIALPYGSVERAHEAWSRRWRPLLRREGVAAGLRVYCGLEGCALLLWWSRESESRKGDEVLERGLREELASFGLPYRAGRDWTPFYRSRLDPATARLLRDLKALFDPDGILNPGVGFFGERREART